MLVCAALCCKPHDRQHPSIHMTWPTIWSSSHCLPAGLQCKDHCQHSGVYCSHSCKGCFPMWILVHPKNCLSTIKENEMLSWSTLFRVKHNMSPPKIGILYSKLWDCFFWVLDQLDRVKSWFLSIDEMSTGGNDLFLFWNIL